jgi:AcrR family transcriptional regulator
MSQLRPSRARRPEAKEARRRVVLTAARGLCQRGLPEALRMADLAERAGLAKGTPFLYFATKEAVLLALLTEELAGWFDATSAALRALAARRRTSARPRAVARLLTRSLVARPLLRQLLALLHGTLEENLELAEVVAFKRFLREGVLATGAGLEAALPGLRRGHGAVAVLRLHALTIGIQAMTAPSPVVRQALAEPELALFDLEFEPLLEAALADLLVGALL